jgi:hypothetical protein
MSILLNDNLNISAPLPADNRYGQTTDGGAASLLPFTPYATAATAHGAIDISKKHIGLTVLVGTSPNIEEYWYVGDPTNLANLVPKVTNEIPTFAQTLGEDPDFTNDVSSDLNGYYWQIENHKQILFTSTFADVNTYSKFNLTKNLAQIGYQYDTEENNMNLVFDGATNQTYFATDASGTKFGLSFNPSNQSYVFGDASEGFGVNNGTRIEILDKSKQIDSYTDSFIINELTTGDGKIKLVGTGYTYSGSPTGSAGYLKIFINGSVRYIALLT